MMKIFYYRLFLGMLGSLLISCHEPVKSVEWYKQHETERKVMIEKCLADPDLATKNQNCRNAGHADFLSGRFTKSPSITWGIEGSS